MGMRREVEAVLHKLLARPEPNLSLDVIGEALGAISVSVDEIDALMRALEQHGRTTGGGSVISASSELSVTLQAARRLRVTLGRAPTPDEIAADAGIPVSSVRSALLFARILQR